jgi:hypothetical protein
MYGVPHCAVVYTKMVLPLPCRPKRFLDAFFADVGSNV